MEKSSHRKTLSSPPVSDPEIAASKTDYGDAEVQFVIGLKFAADPGAAHDYRQAAEWYHKAAEQNHSLAQFNLGMMYAHGQGVRRDAAQSRLWYDKAAQQGDAGAQFNLGNSYHHGSFSQPPAEAAESRIEAYKWYRLAAAQGYQGSETAYATLTLNMTRAEVADGNQRIAAFLNRLQAKAGSKVKA